MVKGQRDLEERKAQERDIRPYMTERHNDHNITQQKTTRKRRPGMENNRERGGGYD